jgi:L-asparaginase
MRRPAMRRITLITTGGTIEKTYDEQTGELANRRSIVRRMLQELRLEDTAVEVVELISKDSLEMTDADRDRIVGAVREALGGRAPADETGAGGVVVLHGTDTLEVTGERLAAEVGDPAVPVVLTGAMRPFEMKQSDALQNLTEAVFASGVLPPGVYCVAHGRALRFPGVVKDRERGTFLRKGSGSTV